MRRRTREGCKEDEVLENNTKGLIKAVKWKCSCLYFSLWLLVLCILPSQEEFAERLSRPPTMDVSAKPQDIEAESKYKR